jgi:hypothetical protein
MRHSHGTGSASRCIASSGDWTARSIRAPVMQRIYHVVWLLSIAMLVYALLFWGLLRRAMLVLFPIQKLSGPRRWQPSADEDIIFGLTPGDIPTHIEVLGVPVPLGVLVGAWLTVVAFPFIAQLADSARRRRRLLDDECLECGRPITSWRGRCPGCGVRIGPG